jgi:hypothetical protein
MTRALPLDADAGALPTPPQRHDGIAQTACVLLFLTLCLATGAVWEPTHDEGVAWRQAIGHLWLPAPAAPASIQSLYAVLGGATERGASDVFDALMVRGGMHPPAYYLMLHWWTDAVGTSRLALNAPAYLFGVFSLFGIYRLTRRLVPISSAPIWAMALLSLSPWFVGFTNLAKPYAITICLSLWASCALLAMQADTKRTPLWRALFVALSLLGLYSIYHYAFVIAWQGTLALLLAWRRPDRNRELRKLALMGLAIAVGFAPWLPRLVTHLEISAADSHYFSGAVPLSEWPELLFGMLRIFGLGEALRAVASEALQRAWLLLALATVPLAAYSLTRAGTPAALAADRHARLYWISLPLLPLAIVLGDLWRETHTLFISKLSFGLFPLGLIFIVRAWHALPWKPLRWLGLGAWALLFATASMSSIYSRATAITPFEAVAHSLMENDSAAHLVVLSSKAQGYVIPLLLTAQGLGVENVRVATAPAAKLWSTLERAAADPSIERVSLVDLAVTYRPQDIWRAKRLHALRGRAEAAGWRVANLSPGFGLQSRELPRLRWSPASAGNPGKTLVLSELANVKYYSMEVAGNPGAIRMRP